MEMETFARRISQLRNEKNISARDMSLSIGYSPNYINGLENAKNYPSMEKFFEICEFLEISPKQFFDFEIHYPGKMNELIEVAGHLTEDQLEILIQMSKQFHRSK